MPEIVIPPEVQTGFKAISKLEKADIDKISNFLTQKEISIDPNKLLVSLESFISEELKNNDSKKIVQAIASFVDIKDYDENSTAANSLAESFKETYSPDISEDEFLQLRNNINDLLKSSYNIKMSIKAFRLIRENLSIYTKSKIISDVRLIFEKDINFDNKKAVLVHNLHITFRENSQTKNFFVSLDIDDVKDLKKQLERAIEKENSIKSNITNFEIL